MATEILIDSLKGETRAAVVEDGELAEFLLERSDSVKLSGNIYLGRVQNVLPGMNAAFVDIGLPKNGFLYAGDLRMDRRDFGADAEKVGAELDSRTITQLVRRGQEVLVQVTKEPGGTKGPRLSSHITVPGRLTVLLPSVNYVGISRKIQSEPERARLREALARVKPERFGVIARTAAEGATEEELRRDLEAVIRLWEGVRQRAATVRAPALLCGDATLPFRCVRDMLGADVARVRIEGRALYDEALRCAHLLAPEQAGRLELYEGDYPLMEQYRLSHQLAKAFSRRVWLRSGGFLVFDATEALTVIDVNTGKFTGKNSLDETVLQLNCEAAVEIARQLRLRDIGGIIVIDFIDMESPEHNAQLTQVFRQALKRDRSHTNLVGLSPLGLMEMTRKRQAHTLSSTMAVTCPECQGTGSVFSYETVARLALSELRVRAAGGQSAAYLIECAPAVATTLMKLGGLPGVRAFACGRDGFRNDAYEISAAQLSQLPAGAHELPAE